MDAIDMLKSDHDKIVGMIEEYRADSEDSGLRANVAMYMLGSLEVHLQLEDEIFYPALGEAPEPSDARALDLAREAHVAIAGRIQTLKRLTPEEDPLPAEFDTLVRMLREHFAEEEGRVFPLARRQLGDRLERLGRTLVDRRQELATIYD